MVRQQLRKRLDKETLEQLYNGEGLTVVQIANRYHAYSCSVLTLMEKYGIPRRRPGPRRPEDQKSPNS